MISLVILIIKLAVAYVIAVCCVAFFIRYFFQIAGFALLIGAMLYIGHA